MKATGTSNLSDWLRSASAALSGLTDTPQSEARRLLTFVLQRPEAWLITHGDEALTVPQSSRLRKMLTERVAGTPLPYLLGEWPFFGRDFTVSPDVLIPRPETELLVEEALGWLRANPGRRRAADVGTGSGCIAVSLALEIPDLVVEAADLSPAALQVTRQNILRHDVTWQVRPICSDLLEAVAKPLDLVCANLPYIPSAVMEGLPVAAYEPRLGLDGGPDGLRQIERLLINLPAWLAPGGLALLEIEAGQGQSSLALTRKILPRFPAAVLPDLAGRPRLLRIDSPPE